MFSTPVLKSGEQLPSFPEDFVQVAGQFGIDIDESREALPQLVDYVLHHWIPPHNALLDSDDETELRRREVLGSMGLVKAIAPSRDCYDDLLLDGGSKPVYDWRLDGLAELLAKGLEVPRITAFSGQRLRFPYDDYGGRLEDRATKLSDNGSVDDWAKRWLATELAKNPDADVWSRPFATEHEIAILALLERFGEEISHTGTRLRQSATSVYPTIPAATVQYEDFRLHGKELHVLNAPAIIRQFRNRILPAGEARPTGQSCFYEWLETVRPQHGASVLLFTHNPNIYRTWLDLLTGAQAAGRSDLDLEGAGAAIEPHRSTRDILLALGKLIVGFYNHQCIHDGASAEPLFSTTSSVGGRQQAVF